MHRRHLYAPHPTAALKPPCKSLDHKRHRLALTECAARRGVVAGC